MRSAELTSLLETAMPRDKRMLRLLEDYEKRIQKLEMWQCNRDDVLSRITDPMPNYERGMGKPIDCTEYVRGETER